MCVVLSSALNYLCLLTCLFQNFKFFKKLEIFNFVLLQVPARRMASSISAVTLPTAQDMKSPASSKNKNPPAGNKEKKKTPLPPPRKGRVDGEWDY